MMICCPTGFFPTKGDPRIGCQPPIQPPAMVPAPGSSLRSTNRLLMELSKPPANQLVEVPGINPMRSNRNCSLAAAAVRNPTLTLAKAAVPGDVAVTVTLDQAVVVGCTVVELDVEMNNPDTVHHMMSTRQLRAEGAVSWRQSAIAVYCTLGRTGMAEVVCAVEARASPAALD